MIEGKEGLLWYGSRGKGDSEMFFKGDDFEFILIVEEVSFVS